MKRFVVAVVGSALLSMACSANVSNVSKASAKADAEYQGDIANGMHDTLLTGILDLRTASTDMQAAAPAPADRGWDATQDAAAIGALKAAWTRARSAYERTEGALAPLFPEIDFAIDGRYDDFLTQLGPAGDPNAFDDQGLTGMHAIERILWADTTPASVVEFEKTLPGYAPAAFPATAGEAAGFQGKLCGKLTADVSSLMDQWQPVHIHIFIAFQGLVSLMNEQREKVRKAASSEEESRYSQRTMVDIRDNLEGTKAVFALFEPWLISKTNPDLATKDGPTIDGKIQSGFQRLASAYAAVDGDALPRPPPTWSSESPTPADLVTPFGELFSEVNSAVDPNDTESIVAQMNAAAALLGFALPGQ